MDPFTALVIGFCAGVFAAFSAIALAFLARDEGKEKARQDCNLDQAKEKL